jgi:hypothetical protein
MKTKQTTRYHLVTHSMAHKLIGLSVTRTPSSTCPAACPLKDSGCYDQEGNCAIHRKKHDAGEYKALSAKELLAKAPVMTSVVRLSIGGDLAGKSNKIDRKENVALFAGLEKARKTIILYSHKPLSHGGTPQQRRANLATVQAILAVSPRLAVNVSCENGEQVDKALDAGLEAVCIVPDDGVAVRETPAGNRIVNCPETQGKVDGCARCGALRPLCSRRGRGYAIGLPVHGSLSILVLFIIYKEKGKNFRKGAVYCLYTLCFETLQRQELFATVPCHPDSGSVQWLFCGRT